jgi:outer membrane lipoprotein-sorting protein
MVPRKLQKLCLILLVLLMPVSAFAITLEEAARQAARQNDAKVLSAKTVQRGDRRIHEIKLLTRDGVVKTVRITDTENRKKR